MLSNMAGMYVSTAVSFVVLYQGQHGVFLVGFFMFSVCVDKFCPGTPVQKQP